MLKKYNDREVSSDKPESEVVVRKEISADFEEPVDKTDVEEAIMEVIVHSDEEDENQNSDEGRDIDRIAAMGVAVDSDDEENDCQETVEESEIGYYNPEQKETWKDVNINPELSREQSLQVWRLINEFKEIFSDVPTMNTY